jgi:hypothetical protein
VDGKAAIAEIGTPEDAIMMAHSGQNCLPGQHDVS